MVMRVSFAHYRSLQFCDALGIDKRNGHYIEKAEYEMRIKLTDLRIFESKLRLRPVLE